MARSHATFTPSSSSSPSLFLLELSLSSIFQLSSFKSSHFCHFLPLHLSNTFKFSPPQWVFSRLECFVYIECTPLFQNDIEYLEIWSECFQAALFEFIYSELQSAPLTFMQFLHLRHTNGALQLFQRKGFKDNKQNCFLIGHMVQPNSPPHLLLLHSAKK